MISLITVEAAFVSSSTKQAWREVFFSWFAEIIKIIKEGKAEPPLRPKFELVDTDGPEEANVHGAREKWEKIVKSTFDEDPDKRPTIKELIRTLNVLTDKG